MGPCNVGCYGRMEQYCTAHMSEVRGFDVQSLSNRRPSEWRSLSPMIF